MKKILKFVFIFILVILIFNIFNYVSAQYNNEKNSFELAKDPNFIVAVKLIISDYYHKGDANLALSIKKIIEQYCYVDNSKIKCK